MSARILVLCLAVLAGPARADAPLSVRVGDHPGFGRLVYEFADTPAYSVSEQPGRLVLTFPGAHGVPDAPGPARNVLRASGSEGGTATVRTVPGARWRVSVMENRLVVDVLDPPRAAAPVRSASASPARPVPLGTDAAAKPALLLASPPVVPVLAQPPPVLAQPLPPRPVAPAPLAVAAPVVPVQAEDLPAPAIPAPLPPPAPEQTRPEQPRTEPGGSLAVLTPAGVDLPFPAGTAAAAFVENGAAVLVFDDRRPLDLSPLRDNPVWGGATVQLLPEATLVRLPAPSAGLFLRATAAGWTVSATPAPDAAVPTPVLSETGLLLPGAGAGRVVVVPRLGGRRLLVGTWRGEGGGRTAERRMPEFALLPTVLGVAVDPVSDRIGLSARADGFLVTAEGLRLASSPVERTVPGGRILDLPAGTAAALMERLGAEVAAAARGGPLGRTADRLRAARTEIALGLGAEAQSLLRAAAAADPDAAAGDEMAGLGAVAAVLNDRPDEAAALDERRFADNGEAALWRALRTAGRDRASASAAGIFAVSGALLDTYPEPLRRRLLPLVAETEAGGGQEAAADALLAQAAPSDGAFDLARAMRKAGTGDVDGALAAYDAVAAGHDLRQGARARVLRTELALVEHRIGPAAAADALDGVAVSWRNGAVERDARLRAAALRAEAGLWRPALDGLRDAAALFPDDRAAVRERMAGVFAAMLVHVPPVMPLDLVTLAGDFPDVLPDGAKGVVLAERLADALTALDLPGRAGPVLARLAERASGAARATLGRRLAAVRLDDKDPAAALAALDASDAPGLPPSLAEARGLLRARALATTDLGAATAVLAALGTRGADDLRATLLAGAGDWRGARAALTDLLARTPTDDAPAVVLRLATAVARLDDPAARQQLREQWAGKLPPGREADLFRLLTAEPVRTPSDLHRAAGEIALARSLPPNPASNVSQ